MAKVYPTDIWERRKAAGPSIPAGLAAEYETLEQLQKILPEYLSVFHSVHWTFMKGSRLIKREVDFVIVNPVGHCLMVEQKMAKLKESPNGIYASYSDGATGRVADQINDSIDGFKKSFKGFHGGQAPLGIGYLFYCPNYRVQDLNAAGLDRENIIDKADKNTLCRVIESRLKCDERERTDRGQKVFNFFRQTFKLKPDVGALGESQEERFTQLSEGPIEFLSGLEMTPLRLRVNGVAGCGKSQIARYFFDKAIENGEKPLLICLNAPLKNRLSEIVKEGGEVNTYHGLIRDIAVDPGKGIKNAQERVEANLWEGLIEDVTEVTGLEDQIYDTLIVDEGQDLSSEVYEVLKLFIKDDCNIVWMEDVDQDLNQSSDDGAPFSPEGFIGLQLRKNFRTPFRIASFIKETLPFEFDGANDLPGTGVGVTGYKVREDQPSLVAEIVERLVKEGFSLEDIVIVTCLGQESTALSGHEKIGSYKLRKFDGYKDGEQAYTNGKLTFETIRRFKGQQAPAIILVDVDPDPKNDLNMRVLYCGMTRATVRLEILGRFGNAFNKNQLGIRK